MVGCVGSVLFFLMIRRPPRSTLDRSSAASDVYKRQVEEALLAHPGVAEASVVGRPDGEWGEAVVAFVVALSLIHISEPTRPY